MCGRLVAPSERDVCLTSVVLGDGLFLSDPEQRVREAFRGGDIDIVAIDVAPPDWELERPIITATVVVPEMSPLCVVNDSFATLEDTLEQAYHADSILQRAVTGTNQSAGPYV